MQIWEPLSRSSHRERAATLLLKGEGFSSMPLISQKSTGERALQKKLLGKARLEDIHHREGSLIPFRSKETAASQGDS